MNLRQKGFAFVIQIVQQPGQMAVTGIEHDMAVTQSFVPQTQQQSQSISLLVRNSSVSGMPASWQRCGSSNQCSGTTTHHRPGRRRDPALGQQRRRPGCSRSCTVGHSIGAPRRSRSGHWRRRSVVAGPRRVTSSIRSACDGAAGSGCPPTAQPSAPCCAGNTGTSHGGNVWRRPQPSGSGVENRAGRG